MTETIDETEPQNEAMEAFERGGTERVEFFRSFAGQWYFRRVAANNETLCQSEGYQNHADCQGAAEKIFLPVPWFETTETLSGASTSHWVQVR